jgi:hypothetical protein
MENLLVDVMPKQHCRGGQELEKTQHTETAKSLHFQRKS